MQFLWVQNTKKEEDFNQVQHLEAAPISDVLSVSPNPLLPISYALKTNSKRVFTEITDVVQVTYFQKRHLATHAQECISSVSSLLFLPW